MAIEKLELTDQQWKQRLTPEQYQVLRRQGTEPAFCGGYSASKTHGAGIYRCAGCGLDLFTSQTKFESGTGWPSFFQPIAGPHRKRGRPLTRRGAHRGALCALRRPHGAPLRGRPTADRQALLHQRGVPDLLPAGAPAGA